MTASNIVALAIRDVPADIKSALVKMAAAERTSIGAVAVNALAAHWGYAYRAGRAKSPGNNDSGQLFMRMPMQLRTRVNVEAARRNVKQRQLILEVLQAAISKQAAA